MRRRFVIALKLALVMVAGIVVGGVMVTGMAIAAHAQGKCPADAAAWQNMYDDERVRHGDAMIALKNTRDQIQAEQQVALNNCRNDKGCIEKVRATYRPKLDDIKNKETLENSRHRQEERTLGQVKRDCKLYEKMERRTKT